MCLFQINSRLISSKMLTWHKCKLHKLKVRVIWVCFKSILLAYRFNTNKGNWALRGLVKVPTFSSSGVCTCGAKLTKVQERAQASAPAWLQPPRARMTTTSEVVKCYFNYKENKDELFPEVSHLHRYYIYQCCVGSHISTCEYEVLVLTIEYGTNNG